MIRLLIPLTTLGMLALAALPQAMGGTVTASFLFSGINDTYLERVGHLQEGTPPSLNDYRVSQTFLATVGGAPEFVALGGFVSQPPLPNAPLRVDLTSVAGGLPNSVLATAYVLPEDVPVRDSTLAIGKNIFADFRSSTALLEAGTSYAIVLSSDTLDRTFNLFARQISVFSPPQYSGGGMFISKNGAPWTERASNVDLLFEVTVTPVPEPSTYALAVNGIAALLAVRRRRR